MRGAIGDPPRVDPTQSWGEQSNLSIMNGKRMPCGIVPLLVAGMLLAPGALASAPTEPGEPGVVSGAAFHPAGAWEQLEAARAADRLGDREDAAAGYRRAATLDPRLLDAWIGLIHNGFPSSPRTMLEGASGAVRAVGDSWILQRRLLSTLFPVVWSAAFLSAVLL
ncbi:MAG: hypothetical protein GF346_06920, partial [Candidatus Eisenbacteria bacterium]|nr:hypothetical protein [Candidatus Latescibacterota bacterium]MBD3302161.1 hypothetical protein [Candidatus Eisenbacteria bacterium]